jgi:hypothetical protein
MHASFDKNKGGGEIKNNMKVILLNKKRLGVTIIIIGLMLILFGVQSKFDSVLKQTALMQSNIYSLKEYEVLNKTLTYKLPSDWATTTQNFGGNEIIYHNNFQSADGKIQGFVEVWNINEDLKLFLEKSKEVSETQNIVKKYRMTPVNINGKSGYEVQYTMINRNNIPYSGYEYFINDTNKFVRFSFFVRTSNLKENMPTIFKTIVETLNYKPVLQ